MWYLAPLVSYAVQNLLRSDFIMASLLGGTFVANSVSTVVIRLGDTARLGVKKGTLCSPRLSVRTSFPPELGEERKLRRHTAVT